MPTVFKEMLAEKRWKVLLFNKIMTIYIPFLTPFYVSYFIVDKMEMSSCIVMDIWWPYFISYHYQMEQ